MCRFVQPYPAREAVYWLIKNLIGPVGRGPSGLTAVPRDVTVHPVRTAMRIAFVGDLLPLRGVQVRVDASLIALVRDADAFVANFEGTLTPARPPWVFMGQRHDEDVLDLLARLAAPERTVLLCANNHSADYGRAAYEASCARLAAAGYRTVGAAARPWIEIAPGVVVAAGTAWSNRSGDFVADLSEVAAHAPPAAFRVLCPHWGYELETLPRREQVTVADAWLARWDLIVGHHSHVPQPVTLRRVDGTYRIVAYSLGNFWFGYDLRHHLRGIVLVVEIGPGADGRWRVGRLRWGRTVVRYRTHRRAEIVRVR